MDSPVASPKLSCTDLSLHFGPRQVLRSVSLAIPPGEVVSLIGPSGCGKSTLLRAFNRMHDLVPEARLTGALRLDGADLHDPRLPVTEVRRRIGMVFQRPNPLPKSIHDNLAYALRLHGTPRAEIPGQMEEALRASHLWDEVKDQLHAPAVRLSGGQQQRLCIARAVVLRPEVLLMDEPTSALDPISTARVEALIQTLRGRYTVVVVTHSMQQARRISDRVAFLYLGELVEYDRTEVMFGAPQQELTRQYIGGAFG
jgi:phosphate transport system ATP-binding protein